MNPLTTTRPDHPHTRPSNEVSTGPTVSGDVLRVVVLGATFLFGALAAARMLPSWPGSVVIGLALGTLVVVRPRTPVPQVVLFVGGAAMLMADTAFDPIVFLLLPASHVMLRGAWWVARVPRSGAVEHAVLLVDLRRAAAIQLACQGLALVAFAAARAAGSGFLLVVAALALVGLVVLAVPRTWWR